MKDELDYLLEDPSDPASHLHFSSRAALLNYVRFADEVARFLESGAKVLDWGCGLGQMSWLLERRGLAVTSYDLQRPADEGSIINLERIVLGSDPVLLPFHSAIFEAVLSCGMLEHVVDEMGSLAEIRRVLRPGGFLFIYQLPQRHAYTELINRWRGLWYHPRRYGPRDIQSQLEAIGFRMVRQRRANPLPKNLTALSSCVRQLYNRIGDLVDLVDRGLSRVPLLNLFCHSIETIAMKEV